ncbi:MAG: aminomethyl transferase family protein [Nitrospirae bacterium]|nr:MAG: aminomethyl transferase family protein [Nitrospirota bacterium]
MAVTPLIDQHRELEARFTQIEPDHVVVNHYGDPVEEHRAVAEGCGLIDRYYRTKVKVAGADALTFLNGQVTNDVRRLEVGHGVYAVAADAKGHCLGDPFIYRFPDSLLVDLEPAATEATLASWRAHVVADDVTFEELTGEMRTLSLVGPRAFEAVQAAAEGEVAPLEPLRFAGVAIAGQPVVVARSDFPGLEAYDLFLWTQALIPVWRRLLELPEGVRPRPFGDAALTTLMAERGRPRYGRDLTERNLPQEAGIEAIAVSYDKGCYLGQEVICRIHSQGHVNRRLTGLVVAEGEGRPAAGDKLIHEGKEAGWITQVVDSPTLGRPLALAYVRRNLAEPGSRLRARNRKGKEWRMEVVGLPVTP